MNQLSVCITNDELELIKQCIEFRLYMEKNHDNEKLEILYAKIDGSNSKNAFRNQNELKTGCKKLIV